MTQIMSKPTSKKADDKVKRKVQYVSWIVVIKEMKIIRMVGIKKLKERPNIVEEIKTMIMIKTNEA